MRHARVDSEFLVGGVVVVDVGYLRIDTDVFGGNGTAEDLVFAGNKVAGVSGHKGNVAVSFVAAMLHALGHFCAGSDLHEASRVYASSQSVARHDMARRARPLPVYGMKLLTSD